jgi:predicted small lipoprotein YifL
MRLCDWPFSRLALIGALATSIGLAACGRKGPLDPPPGASLASEPQPAAAPVGASDPLVAPLGQTKETTAPRATPTTDKRIFLDNLLN